MAGPGGWDPARPGVAAGVGKSVYSEDLAGAILARVAAGESLSRVCETPGMPERHTVLNWAAANEDFGERLDAAQCEARTRERLDDRAARALVNPRRGRPSTYSRAKAKAICARLENGESLTSIGRDPEMPCFGTMLKWVKAHREFEEMYVRARQIQADFLCDEARDVALAATPRTVWVARLRFDIIRWQAAKLAPKKYVERLAVEAVRGEREAEAAAAAARPKRMEVAIMRFERGPNGVILAIPPRNPAEEQKWVDAYGRPYDGPR
jgi:hypothetical protein